eukprot:3351976-Amphidinium_carterae.1
MWGMSLNGLVYKYLISNGNSTAIPHNGFPKLCDLTYGLQSAEVENHLSTPAPSTTTETTAQTACLFCRLMYLGEGGSLGLRGGVQSEQ